MNSSDRKYAILLNILDRYIEQACSLEKFSKKYLCESAEDRDQARSRALIHLYLESTYGIGDFRSRESAITDGSNDGGIDAYHIDTGKRVIEIVQSKFRTSSINFEQKVVEPSELARIEIDSVLRGDTHDPNGNKYNGHIQGLQRRISEIIDINRYVYVLTILANVDNKNNQIIQKLFKSYEVNIVNFERCYREMVLPLLRGEQYYSKSLRLRIDLSNKSASRLSADISTRFGTCQITVVLVPTLEVAEFMSKYKNSILRFNPRSYLEFREQRTNEGIRDSIINKNTGEFALLNNGITILSDETSVNERVGVGNVANVEVINPQIVNGGQTAFTLSRIYDDRSEDDREAVFSDKEVLMRIITLPQVSHADRKELISEISSATNSQTPVSPTDRSASNELNRTVAEHVFMNTGLLYEPRRGEYTNAIYGQFVDRVDVLERSLFTRLILIAEGDYKQGVQKRMMKTTGGVLPRIPDAISLSKLGDLYSAYTEIRKSNTRAYTVSLTSDLAMTVLATKIMTLERFVNAPNRVEDAV